MPRVRDVCGDDAEVLALSVTRFIASGYMTGDVACWDAAHDGAERLLGAVDGGRLVAALTSVMRAIRAERTEDWQFLPASCCRVTEHEIDLLELLGSARERAWSDLEAGAIRVAGGRAAPRLVAALRHAAQSLDGIGPRLAAYAASTAPPAARLH